MRGGDVLRLLIVLAVLAFAGDAHAEKRFAFVVGNDNYVNVPKKTVILSNFAYA